MAVTVNAIGIRLKNILYLTDFSQYSEAALPFAAVMARNHGATVHALHVLTPVIPDECSAAVHADELLAADEMKRVNANLQGVAHDLLTIEGVDLWTAVERAIKERSIDLIVLGTHGRTRGGKLLLGSVAEEIFRRSTIPVLTVGPGVHGHSPNEAAFRSIVFATDFSKPCEAAAPFAVSIAEEGDARLSLLYVAPEKAEHQRSEAMIGAIVERLRAVVPEEAKLRCRPVAVVHYGEPAECILQTAAERDADLIVLGVRPVATFMSAATHLDRAIAHKVVAHAKCPVLTVRG